MTQSLKPDQPSPLPSSSKGSADSQPAEAATNSAGRKGRKPRKSETPQAGGVDDSTDSRYSWILLYEARLAKMSTEPVSSGLTRGRPPRTVPLKRIHLSMTSSDEETLIRWQEIFGKVFGKRPSLGETSAIVATILLERYQMLHADQTEFKTFSDLVDFLLGTSEKKEG